ncbi:hypothetical protein KCU81_g8797, partial [Aureobasidium melanogenum]
MCFENCKVFDQLKYSKQNIINIHFEQICHEFFLDIFVKQISVDFFHLFLVKQIINIKFDAKQLNAAIQLPIEQHNVIIYDFKPTIKLNLHCSTDNTTSFSNSTIPISLLNTSLQNFTPNQPFYLQSLCTSGLEISGLYATLIPTNSNPALQFTSSPSLATQFSLSTSGYLYVLPPSSAYPWQSYSDEKLLANIDASVTEMDFFFNEKEEIDAIGAEMPVCGVDEDGVLQCKTSQTNEVLYCEGEGTVKMAGCVLEGCDAAELAVVYV